MKLVKNIPDDVKVKTYYKGVETSPLGRGYSAKFESIGKKRVGLDKNAYIVVNRGNSNVWRLVKIKKQKGGATDSDITRLIADLKNPGNKSSALIQKLKDSVQRYNKQVRDKDTLQKTIAKVVLKMEDQQTLNTEDIAFQDSSETHLSQFFFQYSDIDWTETDASELSAKGYILPKQIRDDIISKPTIVKVHQNGSESYGHGVARQVLKTCLNEAFVAFFKQYPNNDRFYLNQDLTNQQLSEIVNQEIETDHDRKHVYIILGLLFVLCIKYGITTEHKLSRGILSQILNDPMPDHNSLKPLDEEQQMMKQEQEDMDTLLYYIIEFNRIELINLLKENLNNSKLWEYIDVTDELKHPEYEKINSAETYEEWLFHLSNQRLFYPNAEQSVFSDLSSFNVCFDLLITTHKLTKDLDIFILENLISQDPFTIKNLKHLHYVVNKGVLDDKQHLNIKSWMDTLLDPEKALKSDVLKAVLNNNHDTPPPLNELFNTSCKINGSNSRKSQNTMNTQRGQTVQTIQSNTNAPTYTKYTDFIQNLIVFWSGNNKIYENRVYEVTSITGKGYPMASTCFFQLKLPNNISSQQELYEKLYVASQVKDFALVGGKSKRKMRRKRKPVSKR